MKITVDELRNRLHEGEVTFEYTKRDGSIRKALGTLNFEKIPETMQPKDSSTYSATNLRYFDLEKEGWRSIPNDTTEVEVL